MKRYWIALPILLAVAFRAGGEASAQESALPPAAASETQAPPLQDAAGINEPEAPDDEGISFIFDGRVWQFPIAPGDRESQKRNEGPLPRYVASDKVIVSWSEKFDVAWGYSITSGKWTKQDIQPPATETPVVGNGSIAVVRSGNKVFAYSGMAGQWGVLEFPDGEEPHLSFEGEYMFATSKDRFFVFAGVTGQWTSPEGNARSSLSPVTPDGVNQLPPGWAPPPTSSDSPFQAPTYGTPSGRATRVPPPPRSQGNRALKVTLKHIKSAEVEELLKQLMPSIRFAVVRDSNSLVVMVPVDLAKAFESLVTRLDQPPQVAAGSGLDASSGKLHQAYQALENEAADVVSSIRRAGPASETSGSQRRRLAQIVEEAFTARQRLQQAEVAELTEKLDRVKQQIAEREQIKQQIIDRRVEELLAPEAEWDLPTN